MRRAFGAVKLAGWLGLNCRLMPVEHHYLVTETIPLIEDLGFELPQINDNETGCYARQEGMSACCWAPMRTR